MAKSEEALGRLESAVKRLNFVGAVAVKQTTTDERRQTLYNSLVEIEEYVGSLEDKRLSSLYQRLVEGYRTFMPQHQQVLAAD